MRRPALVVIAKAPVPGRVKTRLCPPCSPAQAAALAEAALLDTLEVVAGTPAGRKILVLEGNADRWRVPGFELIKQRGDGLGDRLAAAFDDIDGPALLVGMDTPQLSHELLIDGLDALSCPGIDAVLGPALDGGYWSIGFKRPVPGVFADVPMSAAHTGQAQRARLRQLGLRLHEQRPLRDVDTIDDARAVAMQAPQSRFAAAVAAL